MSASLAFADTATPIAVTEDGQITPPPPGKAQVVFYRPGRFVSMAKVAWVKKDLGGPDVARLTNGRYVVYVTDPGQHVFITQSEVRDSLTVTLAEGETKFVEVSLGFGIVANRNHLTPATLSYFQRKAKDLKQATPFTSRDGSPTE